MSKRVREKVEEVTGRYPQKRSALLPALYIAQEEYGYLSPEAMAEVSQLLDLSLTEVMGVASFYSLLHRKPVGRYIIQACTNLSCSFLGAEPLVDYLRRKLSIGVGETTSDGRFTLEEVECLGACEMAPVMRIGEGYYGHLTEERIDEILEGLRSR